MLTAAQIISLATQTAKVPNWTSQAGQLLNAILAELCQDYDFDAARGVISFPLATNIGAGAGPYPLPADFLRAEKNTLKYTIQGVPYVMTSIDLAEYDALVQTAGFQSYPVNFATDVSQAPPNMYVWPPASGAYPVLGRYYRQMPDIAAPETSAVVPWFPNQNYLITRLSGELMKLVNDDRWQQFLGDSDQATPAGAGVLLRAYLKMKGDNEGRAKTVSLDRRRFGAGFDRLKSTKLVGW